MRVRTRLGARPRASERSRTSASVKYGRPSSSAKWRRQPAGSAFPSSSNMLPLTPAIDPAPGLLRTLVTVAIAMPLLLKRLDSDVRLVRSVSIVFFRRVTTTAATTTMKIVQHPSAITTTPTMMRTATVVCSAADPIFANSWPAAPPKTATPVGGPTTEPAGVGPSVGASVNADVGTAEATDAEGAAEGTEVDGALVGAAEGTNVTGPAVGT